MIPPGNNNNNLNSLAPDHQKKFMISYSHQVLYHIFRLQGMQLMTNSSTPPDVYTGIMIVEFATFQMICWLAKIGLCFG